MTGYDLFQLIHNYHCNGDIQDTIIEVGELLDILYDTKKAKKLGNDVEQEIENETISLGLCPLCGQELVYQRGLQYEEYQGKVIPREEIHMECCDSSCSYTSK